VRRALWFGVAAAVAALVVSGASATESTIYPGVGIGKIKLGMTLPQVEHVLGRDYLFNTNAIVDNARFRELAWNFASWFVASSAEATTGASYRSRGRSARSEQPRASESHHRSNR
jgi:hypothetical protein